jgi:hypothetical protein
MSGPGIATQHNVLFEDIQHRGMARALPHTEAYTVPQPGDTLKGREVRPGYVLIRDSRMGSVRALGRE